MPHSLRRRCLCALSVAVGVWLAATPVRGADNTVTIQNLGCANLGTDRIEQILRLELGATGAPWTHYAVGVACREDAFTLQLTDAKNGDRIEQGIFADTSDLDRDRWLARVIVDLAVAEMDAVRPKAPTRGILAPVPTLAKPKPKDDNEEKDRKPAPTLTEWLGPAHIGGRVNWRWLNMEHAIPGAGFHGAAVKSERLAIFASIGLALTDNAPPGADLNLTLFHLGGGVTLRHPLSKIFWLESDLGLSAMAFKMVRRPHGDSLILEEDTGIATSASADFLFVWRYNDNRIGFGLTTGWMFRVPVSRPEPYEFGGMDFVPSAVDINGPWLGVVVNVGSAEALNP